MRKKVAKALRKTVSSIFSQIKNADESKKGNYFRRVKKAYVATPRKFRHGLTQSVVVKENADGTK